MLVLNEKDVAGLLPMDQAVEAVEQAFKDQIAGDVQMPAKLYLDFPQYGGDLRVMPAAIGIEFAGVKLVNSHPRNPHRGLPTVVGTYLLFSQETGMPLCLMGGTALTGIRTGAASAVATRYLAKPGSRSVGLVGAGVQAGYQLAALAAVAKFDSVIVWTPEADRTRRDSFMKRMKRQFPDADFQSSESVETAVAADIICTTTPSREPLVQASWVKPGAHINAVGADGPGKQELDPQILREALLIVDDIHQAVSGGEVNVSLASGATSPEDIAGSLADVVAGKVGRSSDEEITVFDSTGLAVQDIAVASVAYRNALETGAGSQLDL